MYSVLHGLEQRGGGGGGGGASAVEFANVIGRRAVHAGVSLRMLTDA